MSSRQISADDFIRTRKDGSTTLTHKFLSGSIEWHPNPNDLVDLFKKLRAFSKEHSVPLDEKLEKACRYSRHLELSEDPIYENTIGASSEDQYYEDEYVEAIEALF